MRKSQWFILAIGFFLAMLLFSHLNLNHGNLIGNGCDYIFESYLARDNLNWLDVQCIVQGEIYMPFSHLSYILFMVFLICGSLEPKKIK